MVRKLHYGADQISIRDDQDLVALLDRIKEIANSGQADWVEISTKGEPHRILIQPGIPIYVPGTSPGGNRAGGARVF